MDREIDIIKEFIRNKGKEDREDIFILNRIRDYNYFNRINSNKDIEKCKGFILEYIKNNKIN